MVRHRPSRVHREYILTVYRWGVRAKLLAMNSVAEMKKPPKASRGIDADTVDSTMFVGDGKEPIFTITDERKK